MKQEKLIKCSHLKPEIVWVMKDGIIKPHVKCLNCMCWLPNNDPIAQYWIGRALAKEADNSNLTKTERLKKKWQD